jgi:predicted metal-dependent hydrolase
MANQDEKLIVGENIDQQEIESICGGQIASHAKLGIELFNKGQYWDAHEALEAAWIEEAGPIRELYKGILQIGVMYLHIERENFIGMAKMYRRASKWIAPWPDECLGLDIKKLRLDMENVLQKAGKLGPERLHQFDRTLFKKIETIA